MNSSKPVALSLLGPFSVTGPRGKDLTPRSQKACAVIALICESPNLRCTRAALQDKLWSNREQAQGASSLRQALSDIRRSFGDHRDILQADMRMVALDGAAITIDVADKRRVAEAVAKGLIYLDGIGVRDPEFDDWLRDRRSALENVPVSEVPALQNGAGNSLIAAPPSDVPLLHLATIAGSGSAMFAEHILHAVGQGVAEAGPVDLRLGFDPRVVNSGYLLEVGERDLDGGTALHLRLMTLPDRRVCWQKSDVLSATFPGKAGTSLARLVNQCIDGTIAAFAGFRPFGFIPSDDPSIAHTATVLHRMWASAGNDPGHLIASLQDSYEKYGRGIDLAWQAFVGCFVIGERRTAHLARFDARRLIRQAIEIEPNNSLVLALASHVYGFVLREFEVSLDLAERSVRLDRNNFLGWTFLGVARVNMGRAEEGYKAAAYARTIAGEGPYRDFIDGVAASTACMTGRFEEAILLGEATSASKPFFAPPLRYLIASYVMSGDYERAELSARRLRRIEPDFDTRLLAEPDYPVEPLRRSGLIDLKKMPLLS